MAQCRPQPGLSQPSRHLSIGKAQIPFGACRFSHTFDGVLSEQARRERQTARPERLARRLALLTQFKSVAHGRVDLEAQASERRLGNMRAPPTLISALGDVSFLFRSVGDGFSFANSALEQTSRGGANGAQPRDFRSLNWRFSELFGRPDRLQWYLSEAKRSNLLVRYELASALSLELPADIRKRTLSSRAGKAATSRLGFGSRDTVHMSTVCLAVQAGFCAQGGASASPS